MRSTRFVRFLYTTLAPLYDALVPFVSAEARSLGAHWLRVRDGERVLDVGTGTGLAFRPLCEGNPSGRTDGLDLTPSMLDRARTRVSDLPHCTYRLTQGAATALPYPENAFDAVFSSYLIDVLPSADLRPALTEMHRVLRPQGRLVLVYLSPAHCLSQTPWSTLARIAPPLFGGARPLDARPSVRQAGFTIGNYALRVQMGVPSAIVFAVPTESGRRISQDPGPSGPSSN